MASEKSAGRPPSYEPAFFEQLFAIEDRHFWFRARNQVIATMVARFVGSFPEGYRVLEAGCGTGNVLRVLKETCARGTVIGMDLFSEGLNFAHQRARCPLVVGDVNNPPFSIQFDLIGMFDVLEHLAEDGEVLRAVRRLLKPGGILLLTVPAHQALWSYFDEAGCHCRRYSPTDLRQKLIGADFTVEFATQFMAGLFPLVWIGRRVAALIKSGTANPAQPDLELAARELKIVPGFNGLLYRMLSWEARWIAGRRRLPFGTSILAVARKRSDSL